MLFICNISAKYDILLEAVMDMAKRKRGAIRARVVQKYQNRAQNGQVKKKNISKISR